MDVFLWFGIGFLFAFVLIALIDFRVCVDKKSNENNDDPFCFSSSRSKSKSSGKKPDLSQEDKEGQNNG